MKQCALHAVAASLVRESGALHGVRVNAGFDVPLDSVCLDGVPEILQVGAGATQSRSVPQRRQRDSDSGSGRDALCDGGLRGSAASGGDCVAPCDGEQLRVSAASGRECDASRDGGLRGIAASGRDCVAPGDVQLRLSAASGRGCFALRDGGLSGHVLASSLLEASILLALLAATLPRVLVQSLLPLLGFGVLVVLAILPY